jgi:DNA-binding Xre family transcriptional regulator
MSAAIDLRLIGRARATAQATDLSPAHAPEGRGARVPDILSCVYDPVACAFQVRYEDLSYAHVGQGELAGLVGRSIVACSVDEFRRGVEVVLNDGTVTSFSAEYPRYLRDEAYRRSVDARRGGPEDLGPRVARHVRQVRSEKGWSVAELARRSGIAAPNVHRVESGKHIPSTATLVRLSEALEVSLDALLERERRR